MDFSGFLLDVRVVLCDCSVLFSVVVGRRGREGVSVGFKWRRELGVSVGFSCWCWCWFQWEILVGGRGRGGREGLLVSFVGDFVVGVFQWRREGRVF